MHLLKWERSSQGLCWCFSGKRRPAFYLTLAGATLLAAAFFLVWIPFVSPVNAETANWTVDSIPGNWMKLRRQWEYAHTIRFVLQLIGLGALLLSVLVETPTDRFGGSVSGRGDR